MFVEMERIYQELGDQETYHSSFLYDAMEVLHKR